MGYAIVLSSNDGQLSSQLRTEPTRAVDDLVRLLGTDSYSGLRGPVCLCGAWSFVSRPHSATTQRFYLTPEAMEATSARGGKSLDRGWTGGLPAWRPGLPRVTVPAQTARSAWWVYADSLPWALREEQKVRLAEQLRSLMSWTAASAQVGPYSNALNRAGGVTPAGEAELFWSGNRLCAREDLLASEQEKFS